MFATKNTPGGTAGPPLGGKCENWMEYCCNPAGHKNKITANTTKKSFDKKRVSFTW